MSNHQLTPRDGRILRVIVVARISTEHQDVRSLDDQIALCKESVERIYKSPVDWTLIKSRGSGEALDRLEYLELCEKIDARKYDLVIAEDMGRICRRVHSLLTAEACEDAETRLIALNDNVDTADESWKTLAMFSALRHETYNKDTSSRIRRSHRHRFLQGGVIGHLAFCYQRALGAKTIADVSKREEMVPFVMGIIEKLEAGASFSEVARWLNDNKIPKGTRGEGRDWDAGDVAYFVRNPVLKGKRVRNRKISKRINKTGAHRSVAAPVSECLYHLVPHLAFVDEDRYDRLVHMLEVKNAHFRPGKCNGESRRSKPRSRTRWPGQHLICGICGHAYVLGRHGQKDGLMCYGAKMKWCWNSAGISRPLAAKKMLDALFIELEKLPEFDDQLLAVMRAEATSLADERVSKRGELEKRLRETSASADRVAEVLEKVPDSTTMLERLSALEREKKAIELELRDLRREAPPALHLPSVEVLRGEFRREADSIARDSPDFCRLMRKIIPKEIVIRPFKAIEADVLVCRAEFTVNLASLLPKERRTPAFEASLKKSLVVEVDERSQKYQHALNVGRMRGENKKYGEIGLTLGITDTAAQHAMKVYKAMLAAGIDDPFVPQREPLSGDKRHRRHLHPGFRFTPKERPVEEHGDE